MQKEKINDGIHPVYIPVSTAISSLSSDLKAQEQEDEKLLATHGKTFHLAARFLPAHRRSAIATLYGFFRLLDDLVDERTEGWKAHDVRLEQQAWGEWLNSGCSSPAPHEALGAKLATLIEKYHIPRTLFCDFLDGLLSDLQPQEIRTFREMYLYCYRVAGTVGLAIAHTLGATSRQTLTAAARLGVGMQLTNILRDVGADLATGRIYLPQDDLTRFGSSRAHLMQLMTAHAGPDDRFRALMRYQIARAHAYYTSGLPSIWVLPSDCRLSMLIAGRLYRRILTAIERRDYDILQLRASTSMLEKIQEVAISSMLIGLWKRGEDGLVSELEVFLEDCAEEKLSAGHTDSSTSGPWDRSDLASPA